MNVMRRQKADLDSQLQKMTQMIGDLEGECSALRRQLESMNRERDDLKLSIERLRDDNDRVRNVSRYCSIPADLIILSPVIRELNLLSDQML